MNICFIFKWVLFHLFFVFNALNEVIRVKVNTGPLLFLDKNPMVWNVVYNYIWENSNNILQPIKSLKPVLSGPVKKKQNVKKANLKWLVKNIPNRANLITRWLSGYSGPLIYYSFNLMSR